MTKQKILIVDDHVMIRDGVTALISRNPNLMIAGEARTGQEALTLFDTLAPDLVILDISLPDMNGMEVSKEILRRNKEAKIIILSMHDDHDYIRQCMEYGVKGYVLKNESGTELNFAITQIAQGKSYFSQQAKDSIFHKYTELAKEKRAKLETALTNREIEIVKLVAIGLSSPEIADKLSISPRTVETHRSHVMRKLNASNTIELIRKVQALHLV